MEQHQQQQQKQQIVPDLQAQTAKQRSKMNYACEACRAAKVKCLPSASQAGICKRCSEFKRECIFRTGPRTRRPKGSIRRLDAQQVLPPPPGPSETFSIDFSMPTEEGADVAFESLRLKHERFISDLVPSWSSEDDEENDQNDYARCGADLAMSPSARESEEFNFNDFSTNSSSASPSSPSATRRKQYSGTLARRPIGNLAIKPQFNLDSASKLLASFRPMLPYCPCIVLPEDADIRSLARDAPFVLLAILAVTSCSASLQGSSLYDEEFRKILGLKFVAGGERSLELVGGLLVYCAWYPFHLRPKNRQLFQYMRMAVDIIHELELDNEEFSPRLERLWLLPPEELSERLDGIRAYLACYINESTYSNTWGRSSELHYTSWTGKCCDALEQNSELEQDHVLVWLVRVRYIAEEANEVRRNALSQLGFRSDFGYSGSSMRRRRNGYGTDDMGDRQTDEHRGRIIRIGLETQLTEFESRMPRIIALKSGVIMSTLSAKLFLVVSPLLLAPSQPKLPQRLDVNRSSGTSTSMTGQSSEHGDVDFSSLIDAQHLYTALPFVRAFMDHVANLPLAELRCFCGADNARLIMTVVLAFRLSFPIPFCPAYDAARGRRELDFGAHLKKLASSPCPPPPTDCAARRDEKPDGIEAGGEGISTGAGAGGGTKKKVDSVEAMRTIMASMRDKYEKKVKALDDMIRGAEDAGVGGKKRGSVGCPMLDGSLADFLPMWEGYGQPRQTTMMPMSMSPQQHHPSSTAPSLHSGSSASGMAVMDFGVSNLMGLDSTMTAHQGFINLQQQQQQQSPVSAWENGNKDGSEIIKPPTIFHDLWATMTMGWAADVGGVDRATEWFDGTDLADYVER